MIATSLTQARDRRQLDFARAMDEVIAVVEQDPEAERFLPKVVWTALALSSHHLVRARRMHPRLRAEMRSGIRDMLRRLPDDELDETLTRFDGPRRRVLARVLRQAGRTA